MKTHENDYDSDPEHILKAQQKMRREVREVINGEIDKGLQGFSRIVDQLAAEALGVKEVGPLSSRLRKRKLNSV